MIFFYISGKIDGGGDLDTAIDSYKRYKVSKQSSQDLLPRDINLGSVICSRNETNWHISLWNNAGL